MKSLMSADQQRKIEQLYENESLTDNLDDASAQALLKWAEAELRNDVNAALVRAAVSAANQGGGQNMEAVVEQAQAFLAAQRTAQPQSAPHSADDAGTATVNDAGQAVPADKPVQPYPERPAQSFSDKAIQPPPAAAPKKRGSRKQGKK